LGGRAFGDNTIFGSGCTAEKKLALLGGGTKAFSDNQLLLWWDAEGVVAALASMLKQGAGQNPCVAGDFTATGGVACHCSSLQQLMEELSCQHVLSSAGHYISFSCVRVLLQHENIRQQQPKQNDELGKH
jgi:hypothetical protein